MTTTIWKGQLLGRRNIKGVDEGTRGKQSWRQQVPKTGKDEGGKMTYIPFLVPKALLINSRKEIAKS